MSVITWPCNESGSPITSKATSTRGSPPKRPRPTAGTQPLSPGSVPEPARPPHGAELLLLGGVLERRLEALGRRRVAVQEVHLDLADEPATELGVADPRSAKRRRRLTARDRGRDVVGDDDRGRLGEDPGLGDGPGARADVADRIDAGELGPEIRLVDRDPAVDRQARSREWIGCAVL